MGYTQEQIAHKWAYNKDPSKDLGTGTLRMRGLSLVYDGETLATIDHERRRVLYDDRHFRSGWSVNSYGVNRMIVGAVPPGYAVLEFNPDMGGRMPVTGRSDERTEEHLRSWADSLLQITGGGKYWAASVAAKQTDHLALTVGAVMDYRARRKQTHEWRSRYEHVRQVLAALDVPTKKFDQTTVTRLVPGWYLEPTSLLNIDPPVSRLPTFAEVFAETTGLDYARVSGDDDTAWRYSRELAGDSPEKVERELARRVERTRQREEQRLAEEESNRIARLEYEERARKTREERLETLVPDLLKWRGEVGSAGFYDLSYAYSGGSILHLLRFVDHHAFRITTSAGVQMTLKEGLTMLAYARRAVTNAATAPTGWAQVARYSCYVMLTPFDKFPDGLRKVLEATGLGKAGETIAIARVGCHHIPVKEMERLYDEYKRVKGNGHEEVQAE